jgi:hypothetical protein
MDKRKVIKTLDSYAKGLSSHPIISGLGQVTPVTAGFVAYFGGRYQQEQLDAVEAFLEQLDTRIKTIEIDVTKIDFFDNPDSGRIIGKVIKSVSRDNRIGKIKAMTNLTVSLLTVDGMSFDEKEIYIDILDRLNVLQLSILQRAMIEIDSRTEDRHKGFGWQMLSNEYSLKGISGALFLQSINVLESNGLVTKNTTTITKQDQTHYVTLFGEQFYRFISSPNPQEDQYL